ncbi:MAG TPA: aminoacyl--tRNA ligase-related protein [Candidatus Dormibacteraeota bacterium]|nr:aminoacyl--tRNA ligase-related protein [Candidatus Dormibacteraeota bacterium]
MQAADLAEMAHVRGCMVIKPWGYGLWEQIQQHLDHRIKALGHENAYFPIFIPLTYLAKEAEHVEGFSKEMAVVTHHRLSAANDGLRPDGPLDEPLIVRPTSETIIGHSMAKWVQSYRDLPLLLNQWSNAVRWELRPRVFLRTTEFLWQEGHTAHATHDEALQESLSIHAMYESFAREYLALALVPGEKPPSERFPGAERSYTIEAMMQDGKALQAGTSHYLGQNFARAIGIEFVDRSGERQPVYTTSWGVSTRLIGAVVMTHGDDMGLRVPPRVAPTHVVVIPRSTDGEVGALARRWVDELGRGCLNDGQRLRVQLDRSEARPVDRKWRWVRRGVPIVLEVGPREAESGHCSPIFRDRLDQSRDMAFDEFARGAGDLLDGMQRAYLEQAEALMAASTAAATGREEATALLEAPGWRTPFVRAKWCGDAACETAFRTWSATIRCIPTEQSGDEGRCAACDAPARTDVVIAKSY